MVNDIFNVHNLYPTDYVFDYDTFENNPEGYEFTADDIAYFNAMELEKYERDIPMTPYEKRLLRKWVLAGHSPSENAGSKYLCLSGSEGYDFLDIYRMDRAIAQETKGMSQTEREAYLRVYMGMTESEDSRCQSLT